MFFFIRDGSISSDTDRFPVKSGLKITKSAKSLGLGSSKNITLTLLNIINISRVSLEITMLTHWSCRFEGIDVNCSRWIRIHFLAYFDCLVCGYVFAETPAAPWFMLLKKTVFLIPTQKRQLGNINLGIVWRSQFRY
jgi:hypothetical protein